MNETEAIETWGALKDFDFRLREGAVAIDAGTLIPGINSNYSGAAPDLGAYEVDMALPHYGPRQ
jgi:hypothetical protein